MLETLKDRFDRYSIVLLKCLFFTLCILHINSIGVLGIQAWDLPTYPAFPLCSPSCLGNLVLKAAALCSHLATG